ncbi:hypothetical protein AURANDRAFT_68290 [Aureococcus anophagefferens]|uniref:Uncharacterized protein n=1 Tax=Aureococcus anophagefferens TaxID=44056 RepID=F0YP47_AURAN|nr:hypothetical protein AURANDRAFT_68290 [Aureococcus anophagefferens]EGB03116.1 hypothetical protein AURANDRAFT_68290 [Aureococcus anophagefferens]|eukprot:XP_009042191.1 hypothetical protein AURANDRAFT_68290 [Aureococcus anophagefferens]
MMKDTNEPCEVVQQKQKNLSVHFPRKKEIIQVEESQLTPYDYAKSSGRATSAVVITEPKGKSMPMKWMRRVDQLLIQNIFSNKRLYQRLKRISFPEDGAGISFVMGINCNTGVPYSCMNELAIGKLWMFLRDSFMEADQGRAIGGIHVGGHISTKEPDQEHVTWGILTSLDRRDGCGIGQWTGCQMWSLTYYSDYRNRQSQRFAMFMMDSVANGAIIGMNEKQEQSEVFRTNEDSEMGVDHTDHKYPPWKDAKRDERGLPEPLQPKDLGNNQALVEKMKICLSKTAGRCVRWWRTVGACSTTCSALSQSSYSRIGVTRVTARALERLLSKSAKTSQAILWLGLPESGLFTLGSPPWFASSLCGTPLVCIALFTFPVSAADTFLANRRLPIYAEAIIRLRQRLPILVLPLQLPLLWIKPKTRYLALFGNLQIPKFKVDARRQYPTFHLNPIRFTWTPGFWELVHYLILTDEEFFVGVSLNGFLAEPNHASVGTAFSMFHQVFLLVVIFFLPPPSLIHLSRAHRRWLGTVKNPLRETLTYPPTILCDL